MGLNKVVSSVFPKNQLNPPPVKVGPSKFPTFPSRKRTLVTAIPKRPSIFRTVGSPKVSVSQATRKTSPVPPTETVASDKAKSFRDYWNNVRNNLLVENPKPTMPVSLTPPIQNSVSNPLFLSTYV